MTEQLTRLKRQWLYIPFAVAGVVVIAYFLLWRAGAGQMKNGVTAWIADQRDAGFIVNHGPIKSEGFPFFLRVHVEDPEIITPDGWRWNSERLSLDALPYELDKLIFSVRGEQLVSGPDIGEWGVNAKDMRASIRSDKARGWVFSMNIGDAAARRPVDNATASLSSLVFDLSPEEGNETTFVLSLLANQFAAEIAGETYAAAGLQTVSSLSQTHLLAEGFTSAQWRASGGALTINGLFADIEETKLAIDGVVTLDAADRPQGAVNAEIQNPAGLTRLLGKTGALNPIEAEAAAAGLSLLALAGGGKIAAPIDMKDGAAEIAGVKIADLPPVR